MISERALAGQLLDSLEEIRWLAAHVQSGSGFLVYSARRPGGSPRTVHAPHDYLKMPLKKANEFFRTIGPDPQPYVYGFVKGRSTIQNAEQHLNRDAVLRLDLHDFFPSISRNRLAAILEQLDFTPGARDIALDLTTLNGALPIGFPTSPILSNWVFDETDHVLAEWSDANNLTYTRYADDLTFSGQPTWDTAAELTALLGSQGWVVNETKTKLMKRGGRQYVTGLAVSDPVRPRIPPEYKSRMRFKVYIIEKLGFETYWSDFGGEERGDRPRRLIGMARHIAGVEPAVGGMFLRRLDAAMDWEPAWDDDEWSGWVDAIW